MKKFKVFLISLLGLFLLATLTTSFSNVNSQKETKVKKTLAYYQGSFVEILGPTFGPVKVWSMDSGGGPVVTATFYSAVDRKTYPVDQESGYCYGHSVQNFDGYVTINGTQYHIQYSGTLSYP